MGIPLFFGRLIEPFFPTAIKDKVQRVTTVCIDFAGIAHQVAAHLNLHFERWTMSDYFGYLNIELFELIMFLNPQRRLMICVDGIAPLGKMNQQRKRRSRHSFEALNREGEVSFDSNQISPGTEFSILLDKNLRNFLDDIKIIHQLPPQVIYSSHRVIGEAEHKIKKLLTEITDPNESIVIVGLDADLILLGLAMESRIFLYRESTFVSDKRVEQFLKNNPKMSKRDARKRGIVKKEVFLDIGELKSQLKRRNIGIYEFIVATSILGNDFLPALPGFNLIGDIAKDFLEQLEGKKFADPFNLTEFQNFLDGLSSLTETLVKKLSGEIPLVNQTDTFYLKFPTKLNAKNVETFENEWNKRLTFSDIIPSGKELDGFDYPSKREDIELYAEQYILTIYWCLKYYLDHQSPNWEWVYYPYWSPTLTSLLRVEESERFLEMKELVDEPRELQMDLLGQLLLIMPRDLGTGEPNEFLPDEMKIFQKKISPVFDMYPTEFQIIRDGVINESDGFAFLPPIDYPRFLLVISSRRMSKVKLEKYRPESVFKRNLGTARSEDIKIQQNRVEIKGSEEITSSREKFHRAISELLGVEVAKKVESNNKERIFPNKISIRTPKEEAPIIPVKVRSSLADSTLGSRDI